MARINRTSQAERDLQGIWDYIASDNMEAADAMVRKIETRLQSYADWPLSGVSREELGAGVRSFSVGNYMVYYRPMPDGIKLLRVFHGARDIDRLFDSE